ncbi:MAG: DUF1786 domain-containing protein [Peptococcaceae bacterium]|nr:DUF1786 domain-containing protein [Peptococcaceae bacterium]
MVEPVLAVDVGSGTQDILLYLPGKNVENFPKMVMPSRTQIVAHEIRQLTAQGKNIFLTGHLMGGGACTGAVKAHLKAGLKVMALPQVAKTFNDDLAVVKAMGVELGERRPHAFAEVVFGDLDLPALTQGLAAFGLELPRKFAVALQDHGEHAGMSNRQFRFEQWQKFILNGGQLQELTYEQAPEYLTRMQAVQSIVPNSYLMDTGAAAIWGMLCDPRVRAKREEGFIAINVGNSHTLGMAIKGERVLGVFEHHTGVLDSTTLAQQLAKFQRGILANEEIFAATGHGAYMHPDYRGNFEFVALTGPRWELAQDCDFYRVAPYGDMMLTGCFGLLAAAGII